MNVDSDHLLVDTGYLVVEHNGHYTNNTYGDDEEKLLLYEYSLNHIGYVHLYKPNGLHIPIKTVDFMLEELRKYRTHE
ncbi:unnamed protein product [Didymodactylos carnosus]|uniref:Uncharacterized protein n=1 Tax=Didymodactylos carnosus TaxID=1234261 RepID=A0A8S2ST84_9BILA|nr:unnamed protein product [Didymodactylos carnosus]CAF4240572.1 unnamed protein product [Didymodactylos carnosus]